MPLRCYPGECKAAEVGASKHWSVSTCHHAALNGQLPALQYLHENGCPWDRSTCYFAAHLKHWDCLQYLVDNKCPEWERFAKEHAEHLRWNANTID